MTKGLWVYFPSPMLSKDLYFPILLHSFPPVHFLEQFPSPSPVAHLPPFFFFIKSPQPCFHKSYPQSKTFLNTQAVLSSAIFCSNAVLIATPSSSMHFFTFFDPVAISPTTTGMTLMLRVFHILLISLFSSWYFFHLFFTNSYVPRHSNINYGTPFILIYYNNIWFSYLDLSVTVDHNNPQNLHFFVFNNNFWSMFISFFTSFQVVFPTKFPMNYSCNVIVPSLVLLVCQLFTLITI